MEDAPPLKKRKTEPFPLLSFPNDIILVIFEQLPSLHSVIALRLTCKHLDNLFKAYPGILQAQRDQITKPLLDYYKFLATLHVDSEDIKFSKDITSAFEWNDWTASIVRQMPHLQSPWTPLPPGSDAYKYELYDDATSLDLSSSNDTYLHECQQYASERMVKEVKLASFGYLDMPLNKFYVIPLDRYCKVLLDTMKAEVWWRYSVSIHERMPAVAFWQYHRQRLLEVKYIPEMWPSRRTITVGNLRHSHLTQNQHDQLLKIFRKHGWPKDFQ